MKQNNFISRFIVWILKKMGLVTTQDVSKEFMCKQAQNICNHDCSVCAWNDGQKMWNKDISFDEYERRLQKWYGGNDSELCHAPIDAQFALDLIFKTLIDDKEHYSYLTTMPESVRQVNSIKLDLILYKYSKEYRKCCKNKK